MSTDEDSGDHGDERLLVAEYALGLLDGAEHARVAARLAENPALRRELALWQQRLSSLDAGFAEAAPPAGVFERVEARLFAPAPQRRPSLWASLGFWRGVAAVCLVLAVIGGGLNLVPRPLPTGEALVAALEAQGSDVKFVAFYDQQTGMLRLAALSGSAVPDKDYELWAIEGKNAPVSMGVIPMQKTDVPMPQTVRAGFEAGDTLAISLEPKGGSTTGAPTGPIVAAGVATRI